MGGVNDKACFLIQNLSEYTVKKSDEAAASNRGEQSTTRGCQRQGGRAVLRGRDFFFC